MKKIMPDEVKVDAIQHSPLLVVWKPEYNLGIPIVDEQHRGVVSTTNSFYYGIHSKHGESILKPIVDMLYDYTYLHFEVEEDLLEQCKFPDVKHHHGLHSELKDTLHEVGRESVLHKDPYQFMEFLKKWWIDHICDKDRVFRDHLVKTLK